MVIQAEPVEFDDEDPRGLFAHLDRWATAELASPEQWADVLQRAGQWAEYSPRNQVLIASYGVVGRVAGEATWAQVPSVEEGRSVAVRSGEHALKVRAPIVRDAAGVRSARTPRGGVSGSVAAAFRWEPVFAAEQLARRPHPDAVAPVSVPVMTDREWSETVRSVSTSILGRRPRAVPDASAMLTEVAAGVALGASRPPLPAAVAEQVGWLVTDRVSRAEGAMPLFDPRGLSPRERWRLLDDARQATGRVTSAVSSELGVDLAASPLPRWSVVDDRETSPDRRNYLTRSDVAGLPVGLWTEVGPYTPAEWAGRGRSGAVGRAAFLRATPRSYLAVYETSGGSRWALETSGRGRHLGLVAEGEAPSFAAGKADARSALRERFPDVALAVEVALAAPVLSPTSGWVSLDTGRDDRTMHRTFNDHAAAVVAPGPGGRWETWTNIAGELSQHSDLAPTAAAAKAQAEAMARAALTHRAVTNPDVADRLVAEAVSNPSTWDRSALTDVVAPALTDVDAARLVDPALRPAELVELLTDSGRVAPATILGVLRAENVPAAEVADLLPAIGLPIPDAIAEISTRWGHARLEVGDMVGATTDELRAAGATVAELLAHSPAQTLRTLDTRPATWERLGPVLMESGHDAVSALRHVADHAPTPETLAVATLSILDASDTTGGHDPAHVALTVVGRRVTPTDLAVVTEALGMDPTRAAAAMDAAGIPRAELIHAVAERVGDPASARSLLGETLGIEAATFDAAFAPEVDNVISFRPVERPSANADLLNALAALDHEPQRPTGLAVASRAPNDLTPDLD